MTQDPQRQEGITVTQEESSLPEVTPLSLDTHRSIAHSVTATPSLCCHTQPLSSTRPQVSHQVSCPRHLIQD